jgi:hypothetical protein
LPRDFSRGVLAISPAEFARSADLVPFPSKPDRQLSSMTNKGLRIELPLLKCIHDRPKFALITILNCHYENDFSDAIRIALAETDTSSVFTRFVGREEIKISAKQMAEAMIRTIYIVKQLPKTSEVWARKCVG